MEQIKRKFKYGNDTLKDPDTSLSPKEVAKYYSMSIPELTNGSVKYNGLIMDKEEGEYMEYEFSTSIGVKG